MALGLLVGGTRIRRSYLRHDRGATSVELVMALMRHVVSGEDLGSTSTLASS